MAETRRRSSFHQGRMLYQVNMQELHPQSPEGVMAQPSSQAAFNSLLTKTHVQHALIQPGGRHNDLPTVRHSAGDVGSEGQHY